MLKLESTHRAGQHLAERPRPRTLKWNVWPEQYGLVCTLDCTSSSSPAWGLRLESCWAVLVWVHTLISWLTVGSADYSTDDVNTSAECQGTAYWPVLAPTSHRKMPLGNACWRVLNWLGPLSRWNVWPQHGLVCTLDCTRSSRLTRQAWVKVQWPGFRRKAPPYSVTRTLDGLKCAPVDLSWTIGSLFCIPNIIGCLPTVIPTLLRSLYNDDIDHLLQALMHEMSSQHFVLMEDFNYPDIDWNQCQCTPLASQESKLFLEAIDDSFVTQHVTFPTRMTATLDLVLSDEENTVFDVRHVGSFSTSDHDWIGFQLPFKSPLGNITCSHSRRDYSKADLAIENGEWIVRNWLAKFIWYYTMSTEEAWENLKSKLFECKDKICTIKKSYQQ